ncbi:MAG: hypothetical protein WEC79_02330 [Thermomicrobiales bacterium]
MMADTNKTSTSQPFETGRDEALRHVRYEDLLRAIGSYVDEQGLTDVLVTQIPDGVLLKGTTVDRSPRAATERISAVLFTNEDVLALLEASLRRRGKTDQLRSRWMKRRT